MQFNLSTIIRISFFTIIFLSTSTAQDESKIELNSIDFIGNEFFSSSDLKEIIIFKETPNWFSKFINSFTSFGNPPSYFANQIFTN